MSSYHPNQFIKRDSIGLVGIVELEKDLTSFIETPFDHEINAAGKFLESDVALFILIEVLEHLLAPEPVKMKECVENFPCQMPILGPTRKIIIHQFQDGSLLLQN